MEASLSIVLSRPLILLDCETTGLDVARDRIWELGFQVYEGEFPGGGPASEWLSLIDPGILIPREMLEAIGRIEITDESFKMCRRCGSDIVWHAPPAPPDGCEFASIPRFAQIAAKLARGFSDCDFAGKNIRFDLRVTAAEMARNGVEWGYLGARIVDAERLEQLAEPRTLSRLYKKYTGLDHVGAHGALADVKASAVLIARQLEAHPSLPADLDRLHALQWPGWIDGDGKFRFDANGVPRFGNWGKHANKPMNTPEVSLKDRKGQTYWDFITSADFPADVKRIAREAKLGRFPVQPHVGEK